MIRRQAKTLVVTEPPSRTERALIAEHERLAALTKRSQAQEARLAELAEQAAGLTAEQVQFEAVTLNALQYARHEANRRAVIAWIEERTALPWAKAIADPQADDLIDAGLRWARLHAAIVAVRARTIRRMQPEPDGGWAPCEYPALDGLDVFVEDMPADLAEALDAMVLSLNEGLFRGLVDSEDAKKNGGISAG